MPDDAEVPDGTGAVRILAGTTQGDGPIHPQASRLAIPDENITDFGTYLGTLDAHDDGALDLVVGAYQDGTAWAFSSAQ